MNKPPKFSRELLDWRRRQHLLAKQKNYAEAQKIKRIADLMGNPAQHLSQLGVASQQLSAHLFHCLAQIADLIVRGSDHRLPHIAKTNLVGGTHQLLDRPS